MIIKEKIVSLDEQIKFIHETRKHLENHPDSEIQLSEETISILRGIEENLCTTRMWINLPDYHQAAMHILDKAFELEKGARFSRDKKWLLEDYFELIKDIVRFNENDESSIEALAAIALIAMGKFVVPNRQTKLDAPVISEATLKLQKLKDWWSRVQLDVMADDYEYVCREIRSQVVELIRENPDFSLTKEELKYFRIIVGKEEVNNG
jgi:Mg2+ and Co2+ transporter CorA